MKYLLVLPPLLALASAPLLAGCPRGAQTVLSCAMKNGKKLDVCILKDTIIYAYGARKARPELRLEEPVKTVRHTPWNGIGRTIWETAAFTNNGYSYEVYISYDKFDRKNEGGVIVSRDGKELARLECLSRGLDIGLSAVSEAKEKAGICWSYDTHAWGRCE